MTTQFDPKELRAAFGKFATGVTVITTEVEGEIHGMTANSFTSVSLAPPLVLVCLDKRTRLHGLLFTGARIGINILSDHQTDISNSFAGAPGPEPEITFDREDGFPFIEGCLCHIGGTVQNIIEAGDHYIYLAKVDLLRQGEGEPLLYYGGRYNHLKNA
ncbi:flavin reductase family protein [Luteithermobacter gelatinilyticus]|uniref:flavin reductase family protein n=1 Tax=Luteithermobacter gelatinilyticus TaxID=2582913 RepID=UPI0011069491|nr:flavin reductase family protein [Luteithermobacter gelatinilyticus]|tara:strand:+ start:3653 stop:4129 length:477 start_codon:yes stop_codon:yes gene_type:complete